MKNLPEQLLDLNIHTITLRPSKMDEKVSIYLGAKQTINYQDAEYHLYHDNIEEMFIELIRKGTEFKNLTSSPINASSLELYNVGVFNLGKKHGV